MLRRCIPPIMVSEAVRRTALLILLGLLLIINGAEFAAGDPSADCEIYADELQIAAVGVPGLDGGRGAIEVSGLDYDRKLLTRSSLGLGDPKPGDRFGASLAPFDANDGDFCTDLAVGAPGVDGTGVVY